MTDLLENLNDEQLRAVTHPKGPLLIVAGAGTGKTTVITRRVGWLIQQGLAKPDEILALTFTDKAAGEMEERLDLLLPLGSFNMWISTFHGFCQRILEQHALDVGLPSDFRILSDTQQWVLVYKNFDKFKLDYYRPIGTPHRFIDALLQHFSRCKDELIAPEDYLKYAEELKLNLDNPDFIGLSSSRKRGSSKQETAHEKRLDSRLRGNDKGSNDNRHGTSDDSTKVFTEDDNSANESAVEIKRIEELAGAFHTYQKLLLENDALDFGDLINYALKVFQDRPNILKFYQKKFKYILVDEFQDTNIAQYELVKLLASGQEKNIAVVGDDDQAIYKFRGASVSNILKFKEDFPEAVEVTLTQNYRSTQQILDYSYNFIKHNDPNRLEVKLGISKRLVNPLENSKQKSVSRKQKTADNNPAGVSAGEIVVLEGKDLSEEIDLVVKQIIKIKQANPDTGWNDFAVLMRSNSSSEEVLPRLEAAGVPYIYLANKGLYRKSLISNIISYLRLLDNYHESGSLYRVLNFSKFQIDAEDIAKLTQFTQRKTLSLYEAMKNEEAMSQISEEARVKISQLLEMLKKHTDEARDRTVVELFVGVITDIGLAKDLSAETLEASQNREFLEQFYKNIEQYEQTNEDKSLKGFMESLELELRSGNEGAIKFDPNIGPEAVKVMTVHSSKGLEFENVFVINMVDQRFPTRAKSETIAIPEKLVKDILPEGDFHLQEERRLFYVAATRAKKRLYLSWSKDYGGSRTRKPSLFLVESGLLPATESVKPTGKVALSRPTANPKKQVYKVLPKKFSYSAINSFLQCPLEYKYSHYLNLPLPGSPYFSFGQTIHKVFELYLADYKRSVENPQMDLFGGAKNPGDFPPYTELEKLYEKNWVDEWYLNKQQKKEYFEKGKLLLKVFYEETIKTKPQVKYLEKFFKLKLGDCEFVGKIDRADATEIGLSILDYKTGKPPKNKSDLDNDQLRIYQLAARDFFHEPVAGMRYWYLEEGVFKEVELASDMELSLLEEHLKSTIAQIHEAVTYDLFSDLHEKSKQHNCRFEGW